MRSLAVKRMTLYPLALKMKRAVSHAASHRAVSDPIVIAIELMTGVTGYGEAMPRPYVTGESVDSVLGALRGEFCRRLLDIHPKTFVEALEVIEALPMESAQGQSIAAARAGVEVALIDAYCQSFGRTLADLTAWMGLAGFGPSGSVRGTRYSGVLATKSVQSLRKNLRLMRLFGLRDFKLKVGFADDDQRLDATLRVVGRSLRRGVGSLRLDANGAWSPAEAAEKLNRWRDLPIAGVEQPLAVRDDEHLPALLEQTGAKIIHDESLVTMADAKRLVGLGVADGFNIRIGKCGGLMPSLRLAGFARRSGVAIQLGCLVGETSILSAAGLRFLQNVPGVRWAEGSFGRFLLAEDVVKKSVRFRYGGRIPRIGEVGLGVEVQPDLLDRLCLGRPIVLEL